LFKGVKVKKAFFIPLLLTICSAIQVYAQETPPAAPAAPPHTCTGSAELSFVSTTGNTDTQTLGIGGSVECKPNKWTYTAKGAFIRSEADDVVTAKSLDTLFRAARDLTPRLKAYGQFIYFQNEFAGIENRYAVEGGLAYMLFTHPKHTLEVDGGIGYTKEDRVEVIGIPDEDLSFATARTGAIYRWKISETAEFGDDAGFTFNLNDGEDWRFANAAYIAAKLNTIFSLKLSYAIAYLNNPVPGFGKTDTITSAALVAKF
jgi:putative salt-induced outer membrane protein